MDIIQSSFFAVKRICVKHSCDSLKPKSLSRFTLILVDEVSTSFRTAIHLEPVWRVHLWGVINRPIKERERVPVADPDRDVRAMSFQRDRVPIESQGHRTCRLGWAHQNATIQPPVPQSKRWWGERDRKSSILTRLTIANLILSHQCGK